MLGTGIGSLSTGINDTQKLTIFILLVASGFFIFIIGCAMCIYSLTKERFFGKTLTLKDLKKNHEVEVVEKLTTDNGFTIFIVRGENGYGDNKVLVGLESRFKPGDCFKIAKQKISGEKIFTTIRTKTKTYDR